MIRLLLRARNERDNIKRIRLAAPSWGIPL
jgi:hypothetical protein